MPTSKSRTHSPPQRHPLSEVWGIGSASREFLYAEDAAEGILLATERYNDPEPVNLGTGEEITIRDLVHLIAGLTGFQGETRWAPSKPDGQPRRGLDTERSTRCFNFSANTEFRMGLFRTIQWHEEHSLGTVPALVSCLLY